MITLKPHNKPPYQQILANWSSHVKQHPKLTTPVERRNESKNMGPQSMCLTCNSYKCIAIDSSIARNAITNAAPGDPEGSKTDSDDGDSGWSRSKDWRRRTVIATLMKHIRDHMEKEQSTLNRPLLLQQYRSSPLTAVWQQTSLRQMITILAGRTYMIGLKMQMRVWSIRGFRYR